MPGPAPPPLSWLRLTRDPQALAQRKWSVGERCLWQHETDWLDSNTNRITATITVKKETKNHHDWNNIRGHRKENHDLFNTGLLEQHYCGGVRPSCEADRTYSQRLLRVHAPAREDELLGHGLAHCPRQPLGASRPAQRAQRAQHVTRDILMRARTPMSPHYCLTIASVVV